MCWPSIKSLNSIQFAIPAYPIFTVIPVFDLVAERSCRRQKGQLKLYSTMCVCRACEVRGSMERRSGKGGQREEYNAVSVAQAASRLQLVVHFQASTRIRVVVEVRRHRADTRLWGFVSL